MKINKKYAAAILVLLGAAGVFGSARAPAAKKTVLDQVALVTHIEASLGDYCNFKAAIDADGITPEEKEFHLRINKSKFQLERRDDYKRYFDVKFSITNPLQKPDVFVLPNDDDKSARYAVAPFNYCKEGGSLKGYVVGLGIKEMPDPEHHGRDLHAFVYIPMRLDKRTDEDLGDEFILLVITVVNDTSQCKAGTKFYARCIALRELAVMQMEGAKPDDFRKAIDDRINDILPPTLRDFGQVEYHNGVVHGTL